MSPFHDLLADEIRESARRADEHERAGAFDLAEWWCSRGEDLRSYLEGTRLRQSVPSPGQDLVRPPLSPALPRSG